MTAEQPEIGEEETVNGIDEEEEEEEDENYGGGCELKYSIGL